MEKILILMKKTWLLKRIFCKLCFPFVWGIEINKLNCI